MRQRERREGVVASRCACTVIIGPTLTLNKHLRDCSPEMRLLAFPWFLCLLLAHFIAQAQESIEPLIDLKQRERVFFSEARAILILR